MVDQLLPKGCLLGGLELAIAGREEAADDFLLALDAEISDPLQAVLDLQDLAHSAECSGIGSHQGVGGTNGEIHFLNGDVLHPAAVRDRDSLSGECFLKKGIYVLPGCLIPQPDCFL